MRNSEDASGAYGPLPPAYSAGTLASEAQALSQYPSSQSFPTEARFGELFRELRRALGLTLPTAASYSGTRIEVIVALEKGDLRALPPWPETVQAVTRLTGLAHIDPGPVLALMHQEIARARVAVTEAQEAAAPAVPPMSGAPLPTMATQWGQAASTNYDQGRAQGSGEAHRSRAMPPQPVAEADEDEAESFVARSLRASVEALSSLKKIAGTGRIVALSAVLIAAGGTIAQGSAIKASFATLQTPISRLLKGAENYLIWRSAPVKDGMRWINVDDPRSRRGDKLKTRPSV